MILFLLMLSACDQESGQTNTTSSDVEVQPDDREFKLPESTVASPSDVIGALPDPDAPRLTWKELEDVTFEEKYYEDIDQYLLFPQFGETVLEKAEKSFTISGYVIPINPGDKETPPLYVLSANPFSACFFCGNAGPESVVELALKDPFVMMATDEFRSFKGTLTLNDSNIDRLNYILIDAEPL